MKTTAYGITFPAGHEDHEPLSDYVARAESLGFDSLWLIDNIGSKARGLETLTALDFIIDPVCPADQVGDQVGEIARLLR